MMELWIRSQAKNKLLKVKCMEIKNFEEGYGIVELIGTGDIGYGLGIYKTKERALEVLDDIQNTIFVKNMYEHDRELLLKSWENFNQEEIEFLRKKITVYEMPEE